MKNRSWISILGLPLLFSSRFFPFYLLFLIPFEWKKKKGQFLFLFLALSALVLLPVTPDPSQAIFFIASSILVFVLFTGLNPENPVKYLNLFVFFISLNAIIEGILKGGRAFTILSDPNLAAVIMASSLPISTPIVSVLSLIGIAFTRSRTGLLLAVVALIFILKRKQRIILLLFLLGLLLIPNPLSTYLKNMDRDPFAFSRIKIWEKSLRIYHDHPIGVGALNYTSWADAYRIPVYGFPARYFKKAIQAHNLYLQFLVELGPFALIFIIFLLAHVLKTKGRRRGVFLLLLMGGLFHSFELNPVFWLPFALLSQKTGKMKFKREILIGGFAFTFMVFTVFFSGRYFGRRAEYFAHLLQFKKADRDMSLALRIAPYEPEVHISSSKVFLKLFEVFRDREDIGKAILEAKRAQALSARNPEALILEIRAMVKAGEEFGLTPGDIAYLEGLYSKVKEVDPKNVMFMLEFAEFEASIDNKERAISILREILEIEPNFLRARWDLYKLTGDVYQLCFIRHWLGKYKLWKDHPYIYGILYFPEELINWSNLPSCPKEGELQ